MDPCKGKERRPIFLDEREAKIIKKLLLRQLEDSSGEQRKIAKSLIQALDNILAEFKDDALRMEELAKRANSNGFWIETRSSWSASRSRKGMGGRLGPKGIKGRQGYHRD